MINITEKAFIEINEKRNNYLLNPNKLRNVFNDYGSIKKFNSN
jgi:hypothetical protein